MAAQLCFAILQVFREVALLTCALGSKLLAMLNHDSHGNKAGWRLRGFPVALTPGTLLWEVA